MGGMRWTRDMLCGGRGVAVRNQRQRVPRSAFPLSDASEHQHLGSDGRDGQAADSLFAQDRP